ncbi:MAG: hypothetical protein A2987_02220 [Omnitrophica bacterium RIFCSPLOWO2_01_FULL_45_10]|nr:MAG: hypothetical protein A2987_02220 [Omnitrophica bacterium RIFCSPLOWO2_01_FULL_45_10]
MKASKGFLLFEVIISIAIITSGLLVVMASYSASKRAIESSQELFEASLLLEEKIFEFEERGEIETGELSGEFEKDGAHTWSIYAEEIGGTVLNKMTLNVFSQKYEPKTKYSIAAILKKKK